MGKKFSKIIVMSMCTIMMIFAIPKMDVYANENVIATVATEQKTNEMDYAVTHSVDEAIAWVESLNGKAYDYDGVYGAQCVDLTKGYYNYLGVPVSYGNGCDYATNTLPNGWQRVQGGVPQRGDILVYSATSDNSAGHVAIYAGGTTIWHGRLNGNGYVQVTTTLSYNWWSNYWGYIRPDWGNVSAYTPFSNVYTSNISNTNAQINAELSSVQTVSQLGFYISKNPDMSDHVRKDEIPQSNQVKSMWFDLNKWYGTLELGTKYYYQLYVIINGTQYFTPVQSFTTTGDNVSPTISNIRYDNFTDTGFWVYCEVSDNVKVEKVSFPTWSEVNGQDDLAHEWPTQFSPISGNTYGYEVKFSEHNNDYGIYNVHIYAYDPTGNQTFGAITYDRVKTVPLEDFTLNKTSATITGSEKIDLNVMSYAPNNTTVSLAETWSSSNTSVATVSATGEVTGVGNGTATISCTVAGITRTCDVTVSFAVTGVSLNKTSATLNGVGQTVQLTATVAPNNAANKKVTWKSSNTAVATVDANGLVKAVGNGTATITVTTASGNKTATCQVVVNVLVAPTFTVTNVSNGVQIKWDFVDNATGYIVYRREAGGVFSKIAGFTDGKTKSYTDKNVVNGTAYFYAVKAINSTSQSTYTTKGINYKASLATPIFTVTNVSNGVQINWNFVDGATGYIIYRRGAGGTFSKIAGFTDGKTKSYTDKNVVDGTAYFYAVKAINSTGTIQSAYTTKGINYKASLATPTFTVANVAGGVQIKWNFVDNAIGYIIYKREAGGTFSKLAGFTDGTKSYIDTNVVDGKAYFYAVKAVNNTTQSTYTTQGINYKATLGTPTFTLTKAANGVKVDWNFVDGATGYIIYRREASGSFKKIAGFTDGKTKSYVDKTAVKGTTYYYAVKAINSSKQSAYDSVQITP